MVRKNLGKLQCFRWVLSTEGDLYVGLLALFVKASRNRVAEVEDIVSRDGQIAWIKHGLWPTFMAHQWIRIYKLLIRDRFSRNGSSGGI